MAAPSSGSACADGDIGCAITEFALSAVNNAAELAQKVAVGVIHALIVLIVGYIVIKIVLWLLRRALRRRKMDEALVGYINSLASVVLKVVLFIAVVDALEVELISLSAVLGALSLSIGLAVGGMFGNFVGGFVLLINKPIVVGDWIEAQGHSGAVKQIDVFHTVLLTGDNKTITVPNGPLSTGSIVNYSRKPQRRIDMVVGVAYDADLTQTKAILTKVCQQNDKVLDEPALNVQVHELGDSSVNFVVRPWVNTADYWSTYWELHTSIKYALDAANIGIPFPQRDIHLDGDGLVHVMRKYAAEAQARDAPPPATTTTTTTTTSSSAAAAAAADDSPSAPKKTAKELKAERLAAKKKAERLAAKKAERLAAKKAEKAAAKKSASP